MKKILVTTDFSPNSQSAIEYAMHLAKIFGSEVELFNSFVTVPAIGIDGGPGVMNETVLDSGMSGNKRRLEIMASKLDANLFSGINLKTKTSSGDPVLAICEEAESGSFDLIIMGTQGESRFEEILFGSTTVDVMKQAKCPVLAIPPDATFKGIDSIVYATDLEEEDIAVIEHLCDLASIFNCEVIVFHAFGEDNMMLQEEANQFNAMLQKQVHYPKLKKESITYQNSHDAILDVIKKDDADMIVMREKKRGIFSRLFHPDMVKRVNYHTTIPLLTYNDDSL